MKATLWWEAPADVLAQRLSTILLQINNVQDVVSYDHALASNMNNGSGT